MGGVRPRTMNTSCARTCGTSIAGSPIDLSDERTASHSRPFRTVSDSTRGVRSLSRHLRIRMNRATKFSIHVRFYWLIHYRNQRSVVSYHRPMSGGMAAAGLPINGQTDKSRRLAIGALPIVSARNWSSKKQKTESSRLAGGRTQYLCRAYHWTPGNSSAR